MSRLKFRMGWIIVMLLFQGNRENVSAPLSLASVHPGPVLISYNYLPIFPTVVRLWTGGGKTRAPEIIVAKSEASRSNREKPRGCRETLTVYSWGVIFPMIGIAIVKWALVFPKIGNPVPARGMCSLQNSRRV
ncbi:hypothetical protein CABS01_15441 [Colletotrichum abscissum]|uniref:uncharacterized protein n=1 Tax=Colletotrichum abscissum TaxID=1671311 RepID=UPI0027D655FB|nr:uncharacterized protein CABS01_15441 [Colletotrichum abscissum]KAK1476219.1 hypothetical protein CABS01_15441 [Colletotrichum abscissum]